MRVQIAERHCDVPDRVLERTRTQMERLAKYQPRASAADVVYAEEKLTKRIEVLIHIDKAEPVVAHADGPDFRAALDQVVDRLRRQLRRQRERRRDHKAPPLSDGREEPEDGREEPEDGREEPEDGREEPEDGREEPE